jgi:hypothetical protein
MEAPIQHSLETMFQNVATNFLGLGHCQRQRQRHGRICARRLALHIPIFN